MGTIYIYGATVWASVTLVIGIIFKIFLSFVEVIDKVIKKMLSAMLVIIALICELAIISECLNYENMFEKITGLLLCCLVIIVFIGIKKIFELVTENIWSVIVGFFKKIINYYGDEILKIAEKNIRKIEKIVSDEFYREL